MEQRYKDIIAHEFERCIAKTIDRLENAETNRPFHAALLSPSALFWSRFERSFSTSFGQRVVEKISKEVARASGATAVENQKQTICALTAAQYLAINNHINSIKERRLGRGPNWAADLLAVQTAGQSTDVVRQDSRVISDLWWVRNGINHYMSIKTVKPNIDQTLAAKSDLLKLKLQDENCKVFYGLYYNPYGENRTDYAWTPPMGIFDFRNDPVILIGRDYWDTIGGTGTYEIVLEIAQEVGERTRATLGDLHQ